LKHLFESRRAKWRFVRAVVALLATATLPLLTAPVGAEQFSERAKEVGGKVKCMCGSCSMTAAGCSHPGGEFSGPCPTAKGMLQQIDQHIAKGETNDQIMQAFVQEYGASVYAEPPKSGFSLVAWMMPTFYLVLGTLVVIFVISRWVKKNAVETSPGSAPTKPISPELLQRARKLAEQETED
jgi:cytochrome c-type biogenesis protein CcmH